MLYRHVATRRPTAAVPTTLKLAILLAGAMCAPFASAQVDATITCDNCYRFGYGSLAGIPAINLSTPVENFTAGAIFDCTGPETYLGLNPSNSDYLYIVTWSDNRSSQGLLAQFVPTTGSQTPVYSGTSAWKVFATGIDYDPGSGGPDPAQINAQIALANATAGGAGSSGGWVGVGNNASGTTGALAIGEPNDNTPPNVFPAICTSAIGAGANWMWYNPDPQSITNPFVGNQSGEFLIFRLPVAQVTNPKRVVVNKDIRNTSGQVAAGVEILVKGLLQDVNDIFHGTTPNLDVVTVGSDTLLRWSGGAIPVNSVFHVGFNCIQQSIEILGIWLVDSSGNRIGCTPQLNTHLHLYGFGGNITYTNSVTDCQRQPLWVGRIELEYYPNEVDLALLNGTSRRSPMHVDRLAVPPTRVDPDSSVNLNMPTPPAGAQYVILSCAVGTSPDLSAPATTLDWVEFALPQMRHATTGCFEANLGTLVGTGDDVVLGMQGIGFPFEFDGVSYTDVHVSTNGLFYLSNGGSPAPGGSACCSGSVGNLVSGLAPRICPLWYDLVLSAGNGGGVYVNSSATRCVITWDRATEFGNDVPFTVQAQLFPNGEIQFYYSPEVLVRTSGTCLVGMSEANGATAGGGENLSANPLLPATTSYELFDNGSLPFDLAGEAVLFTPGVRGYQMTRLPCAVHGVYGHGCGVTILLSLSASPVPSVGVVVDHLVTGIPATTQLTGLLHSFEKVDPAFDLALLGAPGCQLLVDPGLGTMVPLFGSPTASSPLAIPNVPQLVGFELYSQALSVTPGVNALGLLTSNGLASRIGF